MYTLRLRCCLPRRVGTQTLKQVACKRMKRRRLPGDQIAVVQREVDMLKSASHVSELFSGSPRRRELKRQRSPTSTVSRRSRLTNSTCAPLSFAVPVRGTAHADIAFACITRIAVTSFSSCQLATSSLERGLFRPFESGSLPLYTASLVATCSLT